MKKHYFWAIAFFYAVAVFYLAATTPISPHEAKSLFTNDSVVALLMKAGQGICDSFLGLRLFFIFAGFLSIVLFYQLSKKALTRPEDTYLATFVFMLLPGILTGTMLANIAIIVLPVVLLFVLMYEKGYFWILPLLMLILFFIHEASIIFFMAVLLYAVVHKDKRLAIVSSAFLLAFIYLAKGIGIGGRPSGHFVEIFGLYATLFSPFVFLYFFYALYRILLRGKKTLLWYISFTALAFSLLLSIRQKINITDFAPYMMIAVPLMVSVFTHSMRVRLPQFQKPYKTGAYFVIFTLILNALVIITHKISYYQTGMSDNHFAKRIYAPYDKVQELKAKGVTCYDPPRRSELYQFQYYNMPLCNKK
ncbi:hypothetical protein PGH07_10670 [Sulfurovum sp. zt1-1]|uniref:Uncharacterized protein n=1 Tax=Sulfurovum zhangzhouensis TaxID=3019067 RepID=A0ABT7R1F5_9BACT|nr:hypothetical protein [Sulfurovum zhangzhouensis]MDM5272634.1 hypothetical protein [Sulfurovum zhangzhouensis]